MPPLMKFKKKQDQNDDSEDVQKLREKHTQEIKEARERARDCLDDKKFIDFREGYEKAEKTAMAIILEIDETEMDPLRYVFRMKDTLAKVRHLKALLRSVHSTAGDPIR